MQLASVQRFEKALTYMDNYAEYTFYKGTSKFNGSI